MILTIIQNQKQKNMLKGLGQTKDTNERPASEAGRLLWFLVGGITIAHQLGLRGNLSGSGEHHLWLRRKNVRWWGRSFVYACWSLVRILCLAQAFQHFFLLLVLNYGQNHFDDINIILFHKFTWKVVGKKMHLTWWKRVSQFRTANVRWASSQYPQVPKMKLIFWSSISLGLLGGRRGLLFHTTF